MEKIVILSFLFLACAVLVSTQTTTVVLPSPTVNSTATAEMSSSVAMDTGNVTTPTAKMPETTEPTSGAVNMKALAGFIASFALIALF